MSIRISTAPDLERSSDLLQLDPLRTFSGVLLADSLYQCFVQLHC